MLTFRHEPMGPHFNKYHVEGLPFPMVLHHFTAPDHGDPHDHPWGFYSYVIYGGYVEEIFDIETGKSFTTQRAKGDNFWIPSNRIHKVVELPMGECLTAIVPGPTEQTSGFYQFREDGTYHRFWHDQNFHRIG